MLIDLIAQNWADTKIRAFTDVQSTFSPNFSPNFCPWN
jgi:hypothetical protein